MLPLLKRKKYMRAEAIMLRYGREFRKILGSGKSNQQLLLIL